MRAFPVVPAPQRLSCALVVVAAGTEAPQSVPRGVIRRRLGGCWWLPCVRSWLPGRNLGRALWRLRRCLGHWGCPIDTQMVKFLDEAFDGQNESL